MLEGYKILRAINRHGDRPFVVADLAGETGVSEATIRTVLSRESALLEERGRVDTGRRGAKPKRFALRAEARGPLRERLAALDALSTPVSDEDEPANRVPDALLEAQEELLSPGARDGDRLRHEATIGWLGFDAGRRAIAEADDELRPDLEQRLGTLEATLGLVELEQRAAAGEALNPEDVETCRELFEKLRASELDTETQAALDARLGQSPIGEAVAPPLVQLMVAGAPRAELATQIVALLQQQHLSVLQMNYSRGLQRRQHAALAVLLVGEESDEAEIDLDSFADEPVIVFDENARRPGLMQYVQTRSSVYVKAVPELENMIGFARGTRAHWPSTAQRLLRS